MFCPKCKAEYRGKFDECADCNVVLVYVLPKEFEQDNNIGQVDLKELLTTNDQAIK